MRAHRHYVFKDRLRHNIITTVLFGAVCVIAHDTFLAVAVALILLATSVLGLLVDLLVTHVPTTEEQRQVAVSLSDAAPHDPRTLAILLDASTFLPGYPYISIYRHRTTYQAVFFATASALWNAGDDLVLTLTDTRRKRLRGTVNALWRGDGDLSTGEADFCAAAIKAFAVIGDMPATKLLRRIATDDALTANRAFVSSLATDALPILAERAADNASHTK